MYTIKELQLNSFEHTPCVCARDIYAQLGKHQSRPDYQSSDPLDLKPIDPIAMSQADAFSYANKDGKDVLLNAIETFEKENVQDFSSLKEHIRKTM